MNNSTASAPDAPRPARPQPDRDCHAAASKVASRTDATLPDAEILELVERFETAFAELASDADEVQPPGTEPDLFPDFSQDIFQEAPESPSLGGESARVFAMPRRDSEPLSKHPPKPARAPATAADPADEVSLDEALSILHASENRSAGAAPARYEDPARPEPQARLREDAHERQLQRAPAASSEVEYRPEAADAAADWATRSHKVRSIAFAAAVAALFIGIVVGYLYGRNPPPHALSAGVGTSQQGGTQLRLDRELHKR
jgi:hypothetical protein